MGVDSKTLQGEVHEPTGQLEQDIEKLLKGFLEALTEDQKRRLGLEAPGAERS